MIYNYINYTITGQSCHNISYRISKSQIPKTHPRCCQGALETGQLTLEILFWLARSNMTQPATLQSSVQGLRVFNGFLSSAMGHQTSHEVAEDAAKTTFRFPSPTSKVSSKLPRPLINELDLLLRASRLVCGIGITECCKLLNPFFHVAPLVSHETVNCIVVTFSDLVVATSTHLNDQDI